MWLQIPTGRVKAIHNCGEDGAIVELDNGEAHPSALEFRDVLWRYCTAVDEDRKLFSVEL